MTTGDHLSFAKTVRAGERIVGALKGLGVAVSAIPWALGAGKLRPDRLGGAIHEYPLAAGTMFMHQNVAQVVTRLEGHLPLPP